MLCPLGGNASEEATSINENTGIPLKMAVSPLENGSREKTRHLILLSKITFFWDELFQQSHTKNCNELTNNINCVVNCTDEDC